LSYIYWTTTTIHCEDRFSIVKIFNCLFVSVYLPCVGSLNRLQVSMSLLDDLSSYLDNYDNCDFVIAGDFNVNLDGNDAVAIRVKRFISAYSLV